MIQVLNRGLLTVQATALAPCTALTTLLALATIKITVQALSQAPLLALLEVRHTLPLLLAVQAQRKHHMGVSEHLTKRFVHSKVHLLLYMLQSLGLKPICQPGQPVNYATIIPLWLSSLQRLFLIP